ncbi:hypothetical protein PR048_015344 [Dryococelus australis]|uniref:Uncharacterized protein n=1 Tax=Dryococelus australis TaxID=614101 RepID=A0ABQ9HGP6_9NEOP|nr:hypothetical protein PR048_015344 [Dryococelus australis]
MTPRSCFRRTGAALFPCCQEITQKLAAEVSERETGACPGPRDVTSSTSRIAYIPHEPAISIADVEDTNVGRAVLYTSADPASSHVMSLSRELVRCGSPASFFSPPALLVPQLELEDSTAVLCSLPIS